MIFEKFDSNCCCLCCRNFSLTRGVLLLCTHTVVHSGSQLRATPIDTCVAKRSAMLSMYTNWLFNWCLCFIIILLVALSFFANCSTVFLLNVQHAPPLAAECHLNTVQFTFNLSHFFPLNDLVTRWIGFFSIFSLASFFVNPCTHVF